MDVTFILLCLYFGQIFIYFCLDSIIFDSYHTKSERCFFIDILQSSTLIRETNLFINIYKMFGINPKIKILIWNSLIYCFIIIKQCVDIFYNYFIVNKWENEKNLPLKIDQAKTSEIYFYTSNIHNKCRARFHVRKETT